MIQSIRAFTVVVLLAIAVSGCAAPASYAPPADLTSATGATLIGSKQETNIFVSDVRTFVSAVDGKTTGYGIYDWEKPILVAPGVRTIQIYLRQTPMTGSIAMPVTLEMGKTYVVRGFKRGREIADGWVEEKESGTAISEKLTMCLTNDMPIGALFSRCK